MSPPLSSRKHAAFGAEALTHMATVRHVARRLAGNVTEADDLTQETFVRALRSSHQFEWGTNLRAWLLTILKNAYRNRRRDAARAIVEIDGAKVDRLAETRADVATPERLLLADVLDTDLRAAVESLPTALRETVWLCDVEELSYGDIALRLGIPVGTVMSRVFRARRLLHQHLTSRGGHHAT